MTSKKVKYKSVKAIVIRIQRSKLKRKKNLMKITNIQFKIDFRKNSEF